MKRAILKLMVTLVITLLLFNNGIQGMEENLLEGLITYDDYDFNDEDSFYGYDRFMTSGNHFNTLNTVGSMEITGPTENTSGENEVNYQAFGKCFAPQIEKFKKNEPITDDTPYSPHKTKENILGKENPANLGAQLNIHNYEETRDETLPNGFEFYRQRKDGNCQFNAISFGVGNKETADDLRARVIADLQLPENRSELEVFGGGFGIVTEDSTVDGYLKRMAKDKEWGDEYTLISMARINLVRIFIWDKQTRKWRRQIYGDINQSRTIFLSYTGTHYDNLVIVDEVEANKVVRNLTGNHYTTLSHIQQENMVWLDDFDQKRQHDIIALLSKTIGKHGGFKNDVVMEMQQKFNITSEQIEILYEFVYLQNIQTSFEWIEQLNEVDKSKLKTMIIEAKENYGTFSEEAILDISTKFGILSEKAKEAIQWVAEVNAEKNTKNVVESALQNRKERFPKQLKKDKHVLIQLENPKNDLLKTLLMFANPEVYAQSIWTNEVIKTEFEYYLQKNRSKNITKNLSDENSKSPINQLLKMQKNGQCIWEEGMKYIIDLIPDVFEIDIAKYGMNRNMYGMILCEKKKTRPNDHLQKTHPILTISDGHGNFYPVRRVQDLKAEFETSNVQFENVTFSPFTANADPILNQIDIKQDYLNLAKAISVSPYYNPYKDHREKLDRNRGQLKTIKDNIDNYLNHCEEQEHHEIAKLWSGVYNRSEEEEEKEEEEKEEEEKEEEEKEEEEKEEEENKPDLSWPALPEDLKEKLEGPHGIYGLVECFDIYLFDDKNKDNSWLKLDNVIFQKIMEIAEHLKKKTTKLFETKK